METQASTTQVHLAKGIDAAKLERELNAMWSEMSAPGGEGGSAGVVRACVLNLVVYAEGAEERAEVDELLSEVVERHPCRAIVLSAERGAGETRLDAFVAPLLVPDVPVFLWWKDIPHYDDGLFARLAGMADRVVIDSASFDRPHEDLRQLSGLLEGGRVRLSDLNWGSLPGRRR